MTPFKENAGNFYTFIHRTDRVLPTLAILLYSKLSMIFIYEDVGDMVYFCNSVSGEPGRKVVKVDAARLDGAWRKAASIRGIPHVLGIRFGNKHDPLLSLPSLNN